MKERTKRYLRALRGRTPSLVRRYIFSAIFGLFVIATFYWLQVLLPQELSESALATVSFIVLAMLILFPARDHLARLLLSRTDYSLLVGRDFHHLDFLSGSFGRDELIHQVTPELLEWLGARSAVLAISEPDRRSFRAFRIRAGAVREVTPIQSAQIARSEHEILERSTAIHDDELYLSADLGAFLRAYGARVLVPFIYRHRLLGMLLLQQTPRNKHAPVALDTYAGKAAVGVHNYILSIRLVESRDLVLERETASKIQKLLQLTNIPRLPGYEIRRFEHAGSPSVIEFFRGEDDQTWYLTVLSSSQPGGSAALLLFGMMGCLYSYANLRRRVSLHQLVNHLKRDPGLMHSRYRASILTAELQLKDKSLTILVDGRDLDVRDARQPERILISPGWRNYVDLHPGHPLRILLSDEPLLEIALAGDGTGPRTSQRGADRGDRINERSVGTDR